VPAGRKEHKIIGRTSNATYPSKNNCNTFS
jgi:hypothetical protein